jgi:hypothetical protein
MLVPSRIPRARGAQDFEFSMNPLTAFLVIVSLGAGKLQSVKGAGLFFIIPIFDSVIAVIDGRRQTTAFNAEQALTKDTVPVNVDAIIFWHVHDAERAALAITNFREAIDRRDAGARTRDQRLDRAGARAPAGGVAVDPC